VTVPEQREALAERVGGGEHPRQPPLDQGGALLATLLVALLLGLPLGGGIGRGVGLVALGERRHGDGVGAGVWSRQLGEEAVDGRLVPGARQLVELFGVGAEARSPVEK